MPVNLLENGSFEDNILPDNEDAAYVSVEGWTAITGGFIEIWRALVDLNAYASDGNNFVSLDYLEGQDGFSQTVNTVADQQYTLTFDARLREDDRLETQAIEVVWNGEVVATVTPGSTAWEQLSFTVTGTGGADTLTIREPLSADGTTENDGFGAFVDNVSLVEGAPDPGLNDIVGTAGQDTLTGTNAADNIRGLDGNDFLFGSLGNDILDGGFGTDGVSYRSTFLSDFSYVILLDQATTATDSSGNQFFDVLLGVENVLTADGDDVIIGTNQRNFINSGAGNDVIDAGLGDDLLLPGLGNDQISGGSGIDLFWYVSLEELVGDEITDFEVGETIQITPRSLTGLSDWSYVGSAAFSGVAGQFRSDLIGNDTILQIDIDGDGAADGSLTLSNYVDAFNFRITSDRFSLIGAPSGTEPTEFVGTPEADSIIGSSANDVILGLGGNDYLQGLAGNDVIDGGEGTDWANYGTLNEYSFSVNLLEGSVQGTNGADTFTDQLVNIENVTTANQNDWIMGDSNANRLQGNGGDDSIYGYLGDDFISGGDGSDFLNGEAGNDTLIGGEGNDTLNGDAGHDLLIGGAGRDVVLGGEGNDSLHGGLGNDTFDGGDGVDRAAYEILDQFSFDVDLAAGIVVADDGNGTTFTDQLTSIENVATSNQNDTILGDANANFINANGGDDIIDAGGGNDTILSGFGADQVTGGEGIDVFTYHRAEFLYGDVITDFSEGDQFYFAPGSTLSGAIYIGTGAFTGAVGEVRSEVSGANTLIQIDVDGDGVSDGALTLLNYARDFTVSQGSNFFALTGTVASAPINQITGTASGEQLLGTIEADRIEGLGGADGLFGFQGDDLLFGGDGNDVLDGGDGYDELFGGAGDDFLRSSNGNGILDGGDGIDTAEFRFPDGYSYDVDLATGVATTHVGNGTTFSHQLLNIENIRTSDLADTIVGDGAANEILGGSGDDTIDAGGGDDTVFGQAGRDSIQLGAGNDSGQGGDGGDEIRGGDGDDAIFGQAGNDWLYGDAGNDQIAGSDGTDLLFGGDGADRLIGGDGDDRLNGNNDADILFGGSGADTLFGGDGNDTLTGGLGSDLLNGGTGDDLFTYEFSQNFADVDGDVIEDFALGDLIVFQFSIADGAPSFVGSNAFSGSAREIRSSVIGNDTVLEIDVDGDGVSDNSMTLLNYTAGLSADVLRDSIRLAVDTTLPNTDPVGVNDLAETQGSVPVAINVLVNDSDADGDSLLVESFGDGQNGTVTQLADGRLEYTANDGFVGTDTFSYVVSDGNGGTASADVSVTVTAPPGPEPVTIQAEDMVLDAFFVESAGTADGGAVARLTPYETGTASQDLGALGIAAGEYSISVTFFDESYGESIVDVLINGELVGWFVLDQDGGFEGADARNLRTVTLDGVDIPDGAVLTLIGEANGEEVARIDSVQITPSESTTSASKVSPDVQMDPVSVTEAAPHLALEPLKDIDEGLIDWVGMASTDADGLLVLNEGMDTFDFSQLESPTEPGFSGMASADIVNQPLKSFEGNSAATSLAAASLLENWLASDAIEFGPELADQPNYYGSTYTHLEPFLSADSDPDDVTEWAQPDLADDMLGSDLAYMSQIEEDWNDWF